MGTTTNLGLPYPETAAAFEVSADIQALADGVDAQAVVYQGKKQNISAEQSRTNTAYGYLGTEDKVTGIVMPTDGLIVVAYQALFKSSVSVAGFAAIFIGANQAKVRGTELDAAPGAQLSITGDADEYVALSSSFGGLASTGGGGGVAHTSDVTTGQIIGLTGARINGGDSGTDAVGGPCHIFAAAGTYDVGVQFKASSGSVTAKERKLWVWTLAFD